MTVARGELAGSDALEALFEGLQSAEAVVAEARRRAEELLRKAREEADSILREAERAPEDGGAGEPEVAAGLRVEELLGRAEELLRRRSDELREVAIVSLLRW